MRFAARHTIKQDGLCAQGMLPDSPVSSWATLGPLIIVVSVSAMKQGYEDYLRHQADNKINNSLVTVVRSGVLQVGLIVVFNMID